MAPRDDFKNRDVPEFTPAVDIYDHGEEVVVVADMPGVPAGGLDIDFDRGELTIRGRVTPPDSEGEYALQEYQVGDFVRTFALADSIDPNGISAELKSGVLTLRLPKPKEMKPRKIPVKSG